MKRVVVYLPDSAYEHLALFAQWRGVRISECVRQIILEFGKKEKASK